MYRWMAMTLMIGFALLAAEWMGKRRQQLIARVAVMMVFLLYVIWKFAPR